MSGNSTIQANIINGGTVQPGTSTPGTLIIAGSYTQTSAGQLTVRVGGPQAGVASDLLQVNGAATLAGAFNVSLAGGFVPPLNSMVEVLSYASHTGQFLTFNGLALGNSREFQPSYSSTQFALNATFATGAMVTAIAPAGPVNNASTTST